MKPIRCYTCGKVLGNKWLMVDKLVKSGVSLKDVYDRIGIYRYCCKRIVMTSYEDTTTLFQPKNPNIHVHTESHQPTFRHVV